MKPRRYETLVLINPDIPEEEHETAKTKFTDIIERMNGRLVSVDDWGRRRLAYPVKNSMYGTYVLMDYMGTPDLLTELERNMGIEERVWKHLTLVLDKEFTEDKYEAEMERLRSEEAKREAERQQREEERQRREAEAAAQAEEAAQAKAEAEAAAQAKAEAEAAAQAEEAAPAEAEAEADAPTDAPAEPAEDASNDNDGDENGSEAE